MSNSDLKECNHYICSQINGCSGKRKLKSHLRIPCKSSTGTADLRAQTQTCLSLSDDFFYLRKIC